jgi:chaperonin cofactor prefoldin
MMMTRLQQSKQQLEQINNNTNHYRRTGGLKFEDRHKRVTTYLENEVYNEIASLRERGLLLNMTATVNAALKEYINKYFD